MVEWPSGEATACKAVHTGSIPVSTSKVSPGAISSAGERFPDTEEVTGSIPVSRTTIDAGQRQFSSRRSWPAPHTHHICHVLTGQQAFFVICGLASSDSAATILAVTSNKAFLACPIVVASPGPVAGHPRTGRTPPAQRAACFYPARADTAAPPAGYRRQDLGFHCFWNRASFSGFPQPWPFGLGSTS
jgi:hypothetical protein